MYNPQYLNNNYSGPNNYLAPFQNRLNSYEQQAAVCQQPTSNNIVWVGGVEGAKSYNLPYNAAVMLLDSTDSKFYLKSTDSTGMPTIRAFRFEEVPLVVEANNQAPKTAYATKEEFNMLSSKIDSLLQELNSKAEFDMKSTQNQKMINKKG